MKNKKLFTALVMLGALAFLIYLLDYYQSIDPFDDLIATSSEAYALSGYVSSKEDSIKALNMFGDIIWQYTRNMDQNRYRDQFLYSWYERRADIHSGLGNYRLAIEDLNRTIEWNEDQRSVDYDSLMKLYMKRSNTFLKMRNFDYAIIDTENALLAFQENNSWTTYYRNDERELANIYNHRAKIYFEKEAYEKAYEEIEIAIKYKSSERLTAPGSEMDQIFTEGIRYGLTKKIIFAGDILAKLGDYQSATNHYSSSLQAANTFNKIFRRNIEVVALQQRAKSNFYIGQYQKSFDDGNNLLSLYTELENNPPSEVYRYRGRSRYVLGDRLGAKEDMIKAKELNERDGLAHLYLGLLRIERGDLVQGCADLRRAAENNIDDAFEQIRIYCR